MRSPTKRILVDRLDQALRKHGLDLKRSAVIEIMAQAYGLPNSDHLEKAVKAGEIDPPLALPESPGARPCAWLRDPVAGSVFAYDPEGIRPADSPFVLSPYGNLLILPEGTRHVASIPATADPEIQSEAHAAARHGVPFQLESEGPWINGTDDDGRPFQQIGTAHEITSLEKDTTLDIIYGLEEFGLERFEDLVYIDIDRNPLLSMDGRGVSLVDGRVHLTFFRSIEADDGFDMDAAIANMRSIAFNAAGRLMEAGCVLRWTEDRYFGNLDVDLYVPEDAIAHLKDAYELEEAILQVMDAPDFSGRHGMKPVVLTSGDESTRKSSNLTAHWSEANASQGIRIGHIPDERIHTSHKASKLTTYRQPFVMLSDGFGDGFAMDKISTIDGVPHLEISHAIRYVAEFLTRWEAARIIDRMHDRLRDLVAAAGGVMRRINRRDDVVLSIHFPYETIVRSQNVDGWVRAVRSILLESRNEGEAPVVRQDWPRHPEG